jgi:amidohydrolase
LRQHTKSLKHARHSEQLSKLDSAIKAPVAGTGIAADLRGESKDRIVAIRADMDGLPITEETGSSFESQDNGFMHTRGHDAYMSMAVGAARVLSKMRRQMNGTVRFLFKPAKEEGTLGGAKPTINDGALEGVDFVIGQHIWPDIPQGSVGYRAGPFFAASDYFQLNVIGRGGHGAKLNIAVDPIIASTKVLEALQTVSSREVDPLEPMIITVGSIHGGTVGNVIPNSVEMKGTVRRLNLDTRDKIEEKLLDG